MTKTISYQKIAKTEVRFGDRAAYTVDGAAYILSISRATCFRLIRQGRLRSYKEGSSRRVSHMALLAYIAEKEAGNV